MFTSKCAGCGAKKSDSYLMQVEVAIGVTALVCAWRGSKVSDCARKARAAVCCGCGRPFQGEGAAPRGYISGLGYEGQIACSDCRRAIGLGRAEVARQSVGDEAALKFAFLDGFRILGRGYRGSWDGYERRRELACLLARATGGRTRMEDGEAYQTYGYVPPFVSSGASSPSRDAAAEVTADQYEALCGLAAAFAVIIEESRDAGRREGEDLLEKLASGRVTVAAYEDEVVKARKKGSA